MSDATSRQTLDLLRVDRGIQRRSLGRRVAKLAAWTSLIAVGASRRGLLGWLGSGIGLFGLTAELLGWRAARPEWRKAAAHHHSGAVARLLRPVHPDSVDSNSANSFPASDAPTYHN